MRAVDALPELLSLNAAVDGEYELGLVDPEQIAAALMEKYDEEWQREILWAERERIFHERAQARFSSIRRTGRNRLTVGKTRLQRAGSEDFMSSPVYVPGIGWKANADLSASDCDLIAEDRRKRAADNSLWADRYSLFAKLMRRQGVAVLGDVTGDFADVKAAA